MFDLTPDAGKTLQSALIIGKVSLTCKIHIESEQ
jgi:hypothetical protein